MYRFQLVVHPGPSDVLPVRKGDPSVSEEAGLAPTHLDAAGGVEDVESCFILMRRCCMHPYLFPIVSDA